MTLMHQRSVLVVEDDEALRELLAIVLEDEGYQPITAANSWLGLRLAEEHCPDAILLDLTLPDAPGLDVLEQLRARATTRHIPVIAISGFARPERWSAPQPDAFVQKPFDLDSLLQHLDLVLTRVA